MFDSLKKKYSHNFYLPSEIYFKLSEINEIQLSEFLVNYNTNFHKLKIVKISNYLFTINIIFLSNHDLFKFKTLLFDMRELLPPWLAFPDLFQGAPRWNQGYEEDYNINYWIPFWLSLNVQEKEDYLIKYNCPLEWKEWLEVNLLDS